ncbi:30S ribosomal protein S16 [Bacteroidales bacterium OttesenSCG-928-C19]|nr:30S ribosomal protein S16 [Bacteroidales bacterium OttesenSCG-928-C19]
MPVRMRLQRHGKKNNPFFHIVVADGRAPRDGRFIEKIGTYNPMTNPAQINLDVDKACQWLQNGAQPSDTVRRVLSYKGVLLKHHLQGGVTKGALTQEQADAKFNQWVSEKEMKVQGKVNELRDASQKDRKDRLAAELKAKEDKAAEVAAKKQAEEAAKAQAEAPAETAEATEEVVAEAETTEEAPAAE